MAFFSKLLTKTDIAKRLSIPTRCLKSLPSFRVGHSVDFHAIDESGRAWIFRCSIRKKNRSYPKPVLSKGWLAFVHNKKLKVGDKIKFFKEKNQADYRIEAEKEIKIFGTVIGYAPTVAPIS